jgi:hypothetical protein
MLHKYMILPLSSLPIIVCRKHKHKLTIEDENDEDEEEEDAINARALEFSLLVW